MSPGALSAEPKCNTDFAFLRCEPAIFCFTGYHTTKQTLVVFFTSTRLCNVTALPTLVASRTWAHPKRVIGGRAFARTHAAYRSPGGSCVSVGLLAVTPSCSAAPTCSSRRAVARGGVLSARSRRALCAYIFLGNPGIVALSGISSVGTGTSSVY